MARGEGPNPQTWLGEPRLSTPKELYWSGLISYGEYMRAKKRQRNHDWKKSKTIPG